jgi:hypothetical protein
MRGIAMPGAGLLFALSVFSLFAAPPDLTPAQIEDVIAKFAAKETEFARARESYTYRQFFKFSELDERGRELGKWEITSDIIFSPDGKRTERVVRAPVISLQRVIPDPQDEQDLRSVQPFVLTTKDIPKYYVRYLGREEVDEIGCFVFAVKPKKMLEGERYFSGIVWVDDRDLQIVKSYGRGVGLQKKNSDHKYPKFETYREQIDGKYWFPTYTTANDILNFQNGQVPVKMLVRYQDYKQFKGSATITYGDAVDEKKPAKPPEKK